MISRSDQEERCGNALQAEVDRAASSRRATSCGSSVSTVMLCGPPTVRLIAARQWRSLPRRPIAGVGEKESLILYMIGHEKVAGNQFLFSAR